MVPASQKNRSGQKFSSLPSEQSFTPLQTYFPNINSRNESQVRRYNLASLLRFTSLAKPFICKTIQRVCIAESQALAEWCGYLTIQNVATTCSGIQGGEPPSGFFFVNVMSLEKCKKLVFAWILLIFETSGMVPELVYKTLPESLCIAIWVVGTIPPMFICV